MKHLEAFLANPCKSLVDRYGVGVMLFAVFSRARVGDLASVQKVIIDGCVVDSEHEGFIEVISQSHKMRMSSSALGLHLPLIAPVRGVGARSCCDSACG